MNTAILDCISNVRASLALLESLVANQPASTAAPATLAEQWPDRNILTTSQEQSVVVITNAVCEVTGVLPSAILSKSRHQSAVWPRHLAMYFCRQFTSMTLQQIAKVFGLVDHSSVSHAIASVTNTLANDAPRASRARNLSATIHQRLTHSK